MIYDTIIIGSGAAGYAAAIYNGRYGLSTLVLQGDPNENSTASTWQVENYPGIEKFDGYDYIMTLEKQTTAFGTEIKTGIVSNIYKENDIFTVITENGQYQSKSVIYCAGNRRRELGLPNEKSLVGKGVCYCATCDGPLFRNKIVGVVGGGDAATKAALVLNQYVEKVYMFVMEPALIAMPVNIKHVQDAPKIEVLTNTQITEFLEKDGKLSGVRTKNSKEIGLQGIFIEIGGIPNTDAIKDLGVSLDEKDYIKVDFTFATNIPGFYAAGDVTDAFGGFKQIVTASAGGATASSSAQKYILSLSHKSKSI